MLTKSVFHLVNTVPHMIQVTVEAIQKLKFELFPHLVYSYSGDLIHVIYHSEICYMDATLHMN